MINKINTVRLTVRYTVYGFLFYSETATICYSHEVQTSNINCGSCQ